MNRWKSLLAVACLTSSLFATQVFAVPSVSDLRDDKAQAQKEMEDLKDDLAYIASRINNLEIELVKNGQAIIKNEEELKVAEKKEKKQYADMKVRIKAMYENGTGVMLQKVFESGSLTEMLKSAEHVQTIHEYDRKQLAEYVKNKEKIAKLKVTLENDKKTLLAKQEEMKEQKSQINEKIAEKRSEISDYTSQIAEAVERAEREKRAQQNSKPTYNYVAPNNPGGGQAIVSAAFQYQGVPYVWGGASGSGVDCSGLVMLAHKSIGVNLSHYSGSIGSGGQRVPNMASALPGDVVCYAGHVGIYIGNGQMIHAPQTGDVVRVVNVYGSPWFRRYW